MANKMFADTDFILALFKESDWLKGKATELFIKNKGAIRTSVSVMIEVALVCKRKQMHLPDVFKNVLEVIQIDEGSYAVCMSATLYIEKHGLGVFDAFNAAYCGYDTMLSSDSAYDRIGIKRIKLEEK